MGKIIELKDTLLSEASIHYPKLANLNNISDISSTQRIQVNWYPTQTAGGTNTPNGSDGVVFSFCPHKEYIYQIAYTGGNPVRVFTRAKYVNVWYAWKEVLLKEEIPAIPPLITPIISINSAGGATMSWSAAWSWQTVPLKECSCNYGGCFTHESNGVRIGDGVSMVKISAMYNWYNVSITQSDTNVSIALNGADGAVGIGYGNTPDYYGCISSTRILKVNKGDLLQLRVNKGSTGTCQIFNQCCMVVEKIA